MHSGNEHGGLDEHNRPRSLRGHQKARNESRLWMLPRESALANRSGTARYALQVVADWYLLSLSEIMIGTPLARSVPAASVGLARRHGSVHRLVHVLLFMDGGVLALAGRRHVVDA